MTILRIAAAALGLLVAGVTAPAGSLLAQERAPADSIGRAASSEAEGSLAGFDRLIGAWVSGSTRQVFEWGVGRLAVRARSSVLEDGTERLVSEGLFLHDPLRHTVRGYFVAIEMPVAYFEYSARWQGDTLVAHLTTTEPSGSARRYVEHWRLTAPDTIAWTLREGDDEAGPVLMRAEFVRTSAVPPAEAAGAELP